MTLAKDTDSKWCLVIARPRCLIVPKGTIPGSIRRLLSPSHQSQLKEKDRNLHFEKMDVDSYDIISVNKCVRVCVLVW